MRRRRLFHCHCNAKKEYFIKSENSWRSLEINVMDGRSFVRDSMCEIFPEENTINVIYTIGSHCL